MGSTPSETNIKHSPQLNNKNLILARRVLFDVIDILDENNITYHLEGGTLLGLVRDQELLPWDHDIDLSVPLSEANRLKKRLRKLYLKGYKITQRRSIKNFHAVRKGNYRIFKVKKIIPSIAKLLFPRYNRNYIILDIFIKSSDRKYTYWEAEGRYMRVANQFYHSFDEVVYEGRRLRIPNKCEEYLTVKYGDWSKQVKDWIAGRDELTICGDL